MSLQAVRWSCSKVQRTEVMYVRGTIIRWNGTRRAIDGRVSFDYQPGLAFLHEHEFCVFATDQVYKTIQHFWLYNSDEEHSLAFTFFFFSHWHEFERYLSNLHRWFKLIKKFFFCFFNRDIVVEVSNFINLIQKKFLLYWIVFALTKWKNKMFF